MLIHSHIHVSNKIKNNNKTHKQLQIYSNDFTQQTPNCLKCNDFIYLFIYAVYVYTDDM